MNAPIHWDPTEHVTLGLIFLSQHYKRVISTSCTLWHNPSNLSKYYQRGRYLYALMQLVNASHRFLLPAWRCFSFPRDTHGNPMHKLEVCPWGHPWSMTVRSQWINLLLIPEKDDSKMSFTNSSEGPDGFEFISQGQHENTFLFWFSLLPSLLLCKPPPGKPILKIQKAFISDSASWEVSLRKT